MRRAYVCLKCEPPTRVFMLPGEENIEPRCAKHGRMDRQPNIPAKKRD